MLNIKSEFRYLSRDLGGRPRRIMNIDVNVSRSALGSLSLLNLGFLLIDMKLREDVRVEQLDAIMASGSVAISADAEIDVI